MIVTNTATATGVFNGGTVTSNKATATITIDCNPKVQCKVPLPTTCNTWAQSSYQCKPKNGGTYSGGYAYCDELLPATLTCNGVQYQLGSGKDRCATKGGGTVALPSGNFSCLKFLAAGVNGPQFNQCFTVTYTDGSQTSVYQNISDWCSPSYFWGESIASNMPYRIDPNGNQQFGNINLYQYSIPCNSSKTVKCVTSPTTTTCVRACRHPLP